MKERSYLVIEAKEVKTVKEVISSDGLWHFACGDVLEIYPKAFYKHRYHPIKGTPKRHFSLGEYLFVVLVSFRIRRYQWGSWAMHMQLFFLSTWDSLDCNNNPYASLLCTGDRSWYTIQGRSLSKLQLIFPFLDPQLFRRWTQDHRFWGHQCNSRRDKARLQVQSIALHSWLPGRRSPPQRCCLGGSRWCCSCGRRMWMRCQRNRLRKVL